MEFGTVVNHYGRKQNNMHIFIIYRIVFSKLELVCLYNHIWPENGPAYCAHVPQFEVFIRFLKFPICFSENSIFIMRICAAKLGIIYSINCCHLYTFITMMRKLMQCSFLTFLVFSNNIFWTLGYKIMLLKTQKLNLGSYTVDLFWQLLNLYSSW